MSYQFTATVKKLAWPSVFWAIIEGLYRVALLRWQKRPIEEAISGRFRSLLLLSIDVSRARGAPSAHEDRICRNDLTCPKTPAQLVSLTQWPAPRHFRPLAHLVQEACRFL